MCAFQFADPFANDLFLLVWTKIFDKRMREKFFILKWDGKETSKYFVSDSGVILSCLPPVFIGSKSHVLFGAACLHLIAR